MTFDDGVEWLIRLPRFLPASPPRCIVEYVLRSEAATYRVLEAHDIPVAKVHGWGLGDLSRTDSTWYPRIDADPVEITSAPGSPMTRFLATIETIWMPL